MDVAHVTGTSPVSGLLPLVLVVAGLSSALVIALSLAALARRRSLSYFLVTLALATMLARTLIGVLTVNHVISELPHHLLEHSMDILTVLLLLGAVYAARTVDRPDEGLLENRDEGPLENRDEGPLEDRDEGLLESDDGPGADRNGRRSEHDPRPPADRTQPDGGEPDRE